ncbi:phosphotransferase [Glaciimonas sp. GS1]|uniref:Phosphotransferase n=2 Tax=Glaciimonas soli TaxID=2590999 RepID=A0A843YQX0_9BURK|nr:phosphotransferase [Glaciimonas soli]
MDGATLLSHGLGTEPVAPSWPPLTLDEVNNLLGRYPQAGSARRLVWHSPRPFSSACVVETSAGALFVKRLLREIRSVDQLVEEHRFIAWLAQHLPSDGPAVCTVLTDKTGTTAYADGEWAYEVHRLADGDDIYRDAFSWTPFLHIAHATAAGRALGALHVAAYGYVAPARTATLLVSGFTVFNSDDPLSHLQTYIDARPGLASYMAQRAWREDVTRVLMPFHARLQPLLNSLTPLWTHNDWHASNLLWRTQEPVAVATVLDFGLCDKTCAVYDLAIAIVTNIIEWLAVQDVDINSVIHLDHMDALLDGYEAICPLSSAEAAALPAILPLAHVEFALSELAYFYGVQGSAENAAIAYDTYLLGHAEWFNSEAGQQLLAHIRRRYAISTAASDATPQNV